MEKASEHQVKFLKSMVRVLAAFVMAMAVFACGYNCISAYQYFYPYAESVRADQEPEVNIWSDGTTEFMELEYNGEKRQFLYHHSSGKCPHCNYSIPVSESLVPWGTEAEPVEVKDGD